jgi:hypothetical protein
LGVCLALSLVASSATPLDDAISYINGLGDKSVTVKTLMNGLYPVTWALSQNNQLLSFSRTEKVTPVLWSPDGTLFGAIGTDFTTGTRFGAFSADIRGANKDTEGNVIQLHQRTISWLLNDADLATSKARSVIATVSFGRSAWVSTTGYLKANFPNWTFRSCDNTATLAQCLDGADIHFIFSSVTLPSSNSTVAQDAFKARLAAGTPVMFNHDNSWAGDLTGVSSILGIAEFPYAGIYFAGDSTRKLNIDSDTTVSNFIGDRYNFGAWKRLLSNIRDGESSFTFDITQCGDSDACPGNPAFVSEVWTPVQAIKSSISAYESQGVSPLGDISELMNKMVLAGDYLRSQVYYPLNATSSKAKWASYLLSDALYVQLRPTGAAQPDLGDFNKALNSTVPRLASVSVSFQTKDYSATRSMTYSVAAGETVTITRTDSNSDLVAQVRINMIRGNTYAVRYRKYNRPMWLYGNAIPIRAGQTIKLNSAYGGIIFATLPQPSTTQTISFTLNNVVQHPVYKLGTGQSATEFKANAAQLVHGWIEFIHPFVEVHERWSNVPSTLNTYGGNINKMITNFEKYIFQYHYALAGFIAPGLNRLSSVASRAASFGLTGQDYTGAHHNLRGVQHINSDASYAVCGAGCSGNPIDEMWAFTPHGWGEHHEMGHNIQYGLFKIDDGASGEVSNNIFPLAVNWKRAVIDGDLDANEGTRTNVANKLALLQQAAAEGKTAAQVGVQAASLDFYSALLFSGRERWEDDGLQIIPQLYLMERNMDQITNWTRDGPNFGHSLYTSMPNNANDFMVIAFSWLNKLDYRPFFWLWGATWSAKADAQIDSYGFDLVPTTFTTFSSNFSIVTNITVDNPNNPYQRTPAARTAEIPAGSASVLAFSSAALLLSMLLSLLL